MEQGDQFFPCSIHPDIVATVPIMVNMLVDTPAKSCVLESVTETIITDPETGGMKGQKLPQHGAIEPLALLEVAKVAGYGTMKYDRYNYLKGFKWSLSYDALQRHLHLFWSGQDKDEESGLYHLAHACWHCLALISYSLYHLGTDDRWKPPANPIS